MRRDPKAAELIALLRYFATAIEADLHAYYDVDILDWWRGRISARKVLALVGKLEAKSESAFMLEQRGGDWGARDYLLARVANEIMSLRGDHAAVHGETQRHELIESPGQREKRDRERLQSRVAHDHLVAQMRGDLVLAPRPVVHDAVSDVDEKRKAAFGR